MSAASHSRFYDLLFRSLLCRLEPERAHSLAARMLPTAAVLFPGAKPAANLRVAALGKTFPHPFGMAAGFDKNAALVSPLWRLGFSHVEVGTVTPRPQPGNPPPRLFRLPLDRALINRMGFNNDGMEAVYRRLSTLREKQGQVSAPPESPPQPLVGVNVGKNRDTPLAEAAADYRSCVLRLREVADYAVVNVSSPNTTGLRELQEAAKLREILSEVVAAADYSRGNLPVLVKIAPELSAGQVNTVAQLATELKLAGIVAVNTTVAREPLSTSQQQVEAAGAGGLSGPPLASRSLEILRELRSGPAAELCLISVGGVSSAHDVAQRLAAGATLVQGYTAFVYEGPSWPRKIVRGLAN